MPVRIAITDLPIPSVDEQLRAFALGGLTCCINSSGLGIVMGRVALRALLSHGPLAISRYYMNVLLHWTTMLSADESLPTLNSIRSGQQHKS